MGRAPCCAKVGLRRGKWTAEEDEKLVSYVKANGEGSWRSMPINAGLLRCGKSCRLRWINYLRDDLKRGNISSEEEEIIARLQASLGNRWSLIATHLVGRTDNEIKNHWNSHLSPKLQLERFPETPPPVKKKRGRKPKSASGTNTTDGKKPSTVRKLKATSENLKKAGVVDREKKNSTTVGETTTTNTGEPVSNGPVIAPVECSSGSTGSGGFDMRELEEMLSLDNLDGSTWNVGDVDYNEIWENIIDDGSIPGGFFQPPVEITMTDGYLFDGYHNNNNNKKGDGYPFDEYKNLDRWLDPDFYIGDSMFPSI